MMKNSIATFLTALICCDPLLVAGQEQLRQSTAEDVQELRERLPPSVWAVPMSVSVGETTTTSTNELPWWTQEEQDETTKCVLIFCTSLSKVLSKKRMI